MISAADRELIAARCGVEVELLEDDSARAGDITFAKLSDANEWWRPALKDLLPSRPRGDYRERTANLLIRDAVAGPAKIAESKLIAEPNGGSPGIFYRDPRIPEGELRERFGEILHDLYVIETKGKTRFLFPFHTDLPGNFIFSTNYKMFNGLILAFLATPGLDGDTHNTNLIESFYRLFNDDSELSLLDRQALRLARDAARENGIEKPERNATSVRLFEAYSDKVTGDPMFPEAHALFQRDMLTTLDMRSLGRKDRINAVLTVFYLHLALYFWRAGYSLEEQASSFARFLVGGGHSPADVVRASDRTLEGSPFRGKIQFRVPSVGPRAVAEGDPCAISFSEVNNQRLMRLPVNTSLLGVIRSLIADNVKTFGDAAVILASDERLRKSFDAACWLVAFEISDSKLNEDQCDDLRMIARGSNQSGFVALSDVLRKGWHNELRRSTTSITSSLLKRGGKGLAATRGNVQYFEAGQDLLLLLAKLVTGQGAQAVRYETFVERMSLYGLAPQDAREEQMLADVLHSLQLLEKYSDTGEAMYVQHFL
jgi:hypothetical protein